MSRDDASHHCVTRPYRALHFDFGRTREYDRCVRDKARAFTAHRDSDKSDSFREKYMCSIDDLRLLRELLTEKSFKFVDVRLDDVWAGFYRATKRFATRVYDD